MDRNARGSTFFHRSCNDKKGHRFWQIGDLFLYVIFTIIAIVLFLQVTSSRNPQEHLVAVLQVNQKTVRRLEANELERGGTFKLEANGFLYEIEYRNFMVRVKSASCPDKVCVNTGWIKLPGDLAVCLPGHLVLKWENGITVDHGVDVVVG